MSKRIVFEHICEIDSTNAELSRRILSGSLIAPLCLSADTQTSGRGRRGRSWLNTDGALMMSIAYDTAGIASEKLPLISFAAALGVHDAVSKHISCIAIKWPNDIVCTDGDCIEKLCGILCELVFAPHGAAFAVIGIGINVNSKSLPKELMMPATSMLLKLHAVTDVELLKKQIALSVLERLKGLKTDFENTISEYSLRCITLNRAVIASSIDGRIVAEGVARCVLSDGRLVIETTAGEICVDAADVSIRTSGRSTE